MLFAYIMIAKHIRVYTSYWFLNHFIITKAKGERGSQLVNTPTHTRIAPKVEVAAMSAVQTCVKYEAGRHHSQKLRCEWTLWRCIVQGPSVLPSTMIWIPVCVILQFVLYFG